MKELKITITALVLIGLFSCSQSGTVKNSETNEIVKVVDEGREEIKDLGVFPNKLNELEFEVLKEKGTERPFTGDLLKNKEEGTYTCRGCNAPLFTSSSKFTSGTGWPSFDLPINNSAIKENVDKAYGMTRTEVVCSSCDGHLGHLFNDGPTSTGNRYCINSCSLDFSKSDSIQH